MAYTTINKSTEHFDTKVYTGNGSSQTLDMDNLGLLWMKNRTETSNYNLFDSVRGGYYTSAPGPNLRTNDTTAGHGSDITSAYGINFGSSSSTIGSDGGGYNYNQNGKSYVGWQWRANGAGSANTDGSISSTVSANTTSGFSIVKYTGNASSGATIGHGLGSGSVPKMIMVKNLSISSNWLVYSYSMSANGDYALFLDSTSAKDNSQDYWGDTTPTSSVFSLGARQEANGNGNSMIAYCFADVQGFSKFGSYTGNGSADGAFVYTGFKPAWLMAKRTDSADQWVVQDGVRAPFNEVDVRLFADDSGAEQTNGYGDVDFLANGFKWRTNSATLNASGGSYIYMAFAEAPLVGANNTPCTAR